MKEEQFVFGDTFTPIPNELIEDLPLRHWSFRVYCYMLMVSRGTLVCEATIGEIAKDLLMSKHMVEMSLKQLVTLYWITRIPNPGKPSSTVIHTSPEECKEYREELARIDRELFYDR